MNSGSAIANSLQKARNAETVQASSVSSIWLTPISRNIFVKHPNPITPDCSQFSQGARATQLVGSGDALSIGMMQLNVAYHNEYYSGKLFTDVARRPAMGLISYMGGDGPEGSGFGPLFRRALLQGGTSQAGGQDMSCLTQGADRGDRMNYRNLIRAAWSIYNGGPGAPVCRLKTSDANDREFLQI